MKHMKHRLLDRLLLGREYEDVHAWMDEPAKWLGPRHRILRHSPLEVLVKYHNDPNRLASAMLHILADKAESRVRGGRRRA